MIELRKSMVESDVAEVLYYVLSDKWEDLPETVCCKRDFENVVEITVGEVDDAVCSYMQSVEKQGFIYGFKYAMDLFTDCNLDVIVSRRHIYDSDARKQHK